MLPLAEEFDACRGNVELPVFDTFRVPPGHGKSWNLGRPFSRPGSHGK